MTETMTSLEIADIEGLCETDGEGTVSLAEEDFTRICEQAKRVHELSTRLLAAERDAALWNGLALLHPMDIATVICGAPDEKAMMAGLAKRIRAALAGSAQEE
jgi:hypothetical protein